MSEKITTTYLDPETGVESRANPRAIRMTYTDPNGVRRTGYSIDNRMYEDEAGTRRIGVGSIVTNAAGTKTWIMTADGGVDYAEYMAGRGTAPLAAAKDAALSAAQKRIDANVAQIEDERPRLNAKYDSLARQNYQGYLNDERAMANGLAAAGLYNSGYSDTERVRAQNGYRERGNENERARLAAISDLERRIADARGAGSAELGELEAKYLQMIQTQQNADRDYRYQLSRDAIADARYDDQQSYARQRDAIADARYDDQQSYARQRDAIADARYGEELAYDRSRDAVADERFERSYEDSRADVLFQQNQALRNAATAEGQRAVENAYRAAELGDFAPLRALGIDTSAAEKLYALETQKLYQSVYGGSGGKTAPGNTASAAVEEALPSYAMRLMEDNPVLYEEILRMADGFASSQLASPLSAREVADGGLRTRVERQIIGYRDYLTERYGEDAYRLYRYAVLRQMPWTQPTDEATAGEPDEGKSLRVYTADDLYSTYASQIYDKVSTGVTDTDRYGRVTKDTVTTTKKNASEVKNVCRTIRRLFENGQLEAGELALLLDRLGIAEEYAIMEP